MLPYRCVRAQSLCVRAPVRSVRLARAMHMGRTLPRPRDTEARPGRDRGRRGPGPRGGERGGGGRGGGSVEGRRPLRVEYISSRPGAPDRAGGRPSAPRAPPAVPLLRSLLPGPGVQNPVLGPCSLRLPAASPCPVPWARYGGGDSLFPPCSVGRGTRSPALGPCSTCSRAGDMFHGACSTDRGAQYPLYCVEKA
jgi:hypothetical protein